MDSTSGKATVLAKLLGFYTVEIKNLETGGVQAKADLLVMENLFYDQKISKTFDLKGISGRRVRAAPTGSTLTSKTLFDGEWIEGTFHTTVCGLKLTRPWRSTTNPHVTATAFDACAQRSYKKRCRLLDAE